MEKNLLDELRRRLTARSLHDLRQVGRVLGVPHPADGAKDVLISGIMGIASGDADPVVRSKKGAPPKSEEYDRQLVIDVLKCRESVLAKSVKPEEEQRHNIMVSCDDDADKLDFVGEGILESSAGNWFLRVNGCGEDFSSGIYVNEHYVKTFKLREGDLIKGQCRREDLSQMAGLATVISVNGAMPVALDSRPHFENLTPVYADRQLSVARNAGDKLGRTVDLFAPIGAGQRALVITPYGCDKTATLKGIATGICANNPEVKLVLVLIDISPEDATDLSRSFTNANIFISSIDAGTHSHAHTMRLALEYCKRQTELGKDVVLFVDDMTKLTRAYNLLNRQVSTGLDYSAVDSAKRVLASARNTAEGGSLTVISSLCQGSEDAVDSAIYSALKDVCNLKITLSFTLARRRIMPPVDLMHTYSMSDERLLTVKALDFAGACRDSGIEKLLPLFESTEDNSQLINKAVR